MTVGSRQRVVMFSGGAGSWATARRVVDQHGVDGLTLLFADTLIEDEDLYRFLDEAAADIGAPLVKLQEGRDPWQVFFDERYLGNTRIDPCSKILKRKFLRRYLAEHFEPENTTVYIGIDWTESHRLDRAAGYWRPWTVEAPPCGPPYISKPQILEQLETRGIRAPRLYAMGFPHNNCGGFCIKAGQGWFKLLLEKLPERYAHHEAKEQELREFLGKDVAILRDRRGGTTRPLTLRELRERVEADQPVDTDEWGGCACFSPSDDEIADEHRKSP